jgi:hypothetical protein
MAMTDKKGAQTVLNQWGSNLWYSFTAERRRAYREGDDDPTPRIVRENVFGGERWNGDWPPEAAAGFVAWFQELLADIPDEWRQSARIELGSMGGYEGDHSPTIEVTFDRLETPDEIAERQEGWRWQQAEAVARQRSEYEALKAKFEAAPVPPQ